MTRVGRITASAVVLITCLYADSSAKKAPAAGSVVQSGYIPPESGAARALLDKYDSNGFARRLYYPFFTSKFKTPDLVASDFLGRYAGVLGIRDDGSDLELISPVRSLSGYHYRYQQVYQNIPVFASEVLVNITFDGAVSSVISDYRHFESAASSPALSETSAIDISIDDIDAVSLRGEPDIELVLYGKEDDVRLCWKVLVPASEPLGDWQVFVDATNGEIAGKSNVMTFVDGSGYVFDPNPIVSERNIDLADSSDHDYPALSAARFDMVLENLNPPQGGQYYLSGPYVNTGPTSNRAHEADPDAFHYDRENDWFEEVVVYYQINACHEFYESLGFDNITNFSISANVNGTTDDNSWYSPYNRQLTFGSGGVDDAEDADVIIHEYGHATQHDQVPNWGQSHEGGSMGEGFGDYISVAFAHPVFNDWDEAQVFDWDANPRDHYWPGRRVDSNKHYPEDMHGEVHADGEIWSRCLWDMQNSIAYDTAAQLVLESHFYLSPSADFEDGANAIVEADLNLYSGVHLMQIGQAFVDRGILQEMPIELEIYHQPLTDTEDEDGPYTATATFDHTNPIDHAEIYYKYESGPDFTMIEMVPDGNGEEYAADLPGPGEAMSVFYYIEVVDNIGLTSTLPESAPDSAFAFYAGPDIIPPVIDHEPIEDLPDTEWPPTLTAAITDNIGVGSASVEFKINSGDVQAFDLAYDQDLRLWEGEFTGTVIPGDIVEYRIMAIDSSSNNNVAYLPEDGFFSFEILQMMEVTYLTDGDPTPIPDGNGSNIFDTLVVAEDYQIYDAHIYSNIVHPYIGDLYFVIWSPENVRLMLHNRTGGDIDNIIGWYDDDFPPDDTSGMDKFNGHRSGGGWRIFLADIIPGNEGTLNQWGVRLLVAGTPTGIENQTAALPDKFMMSQNYPNPFNPSTNISFNLPEQGKTRLEVYDLLGRRVATLVDGYMQAGMHMVTWDGGSLGDRAASGIYFARLTHEGNSETIRMTLLK